MTLGIPNSLSDSLCQVSTSPIPTPTAVIPARMTSIGAFGLPLSHTFLIQKLIRSSWCSCGVRRIAKLQPRVALVATPGAATDAVAAGAGVAAATTVGAAGAAGSAAAAAAADTADSDDDFDAQLDMAAELQQGERERYHGDRDRESVAAVASATTATTAAANPSRSKAVPTQVKKSDSVTTHLTAISLLDCFQSTISPFCCSSHRHSLHRLFIGAGTKLRSGAFIQSRI